MARSKKKRKKASGPKGKPNARAVSSEGAVETSAEPVEQALPDEVPVESRAESEGGRWTRLFAKAVPWLCLLGCAAVVFWIRMSPWSLPGLEDRAEHDVRRELAVELAAAERAASGSDDKGRRDDLVDAWIAEHADEFSKRKKNASSALKEEHRFTAEDGQSYPYLGGVDGYLWMRHARNFIAGGSTCDAVVDGECRDTQTLAPVGTRMVYDRSVHISAIVAVHWLFSFFRPGFPLSGSAFLVPVFVGMLGVVPAFFLARRFAGTAGGAFAALLSGLNPPYLSRSIASDNDVWNVVLPLFMVWTATEALAARTWPRRVTLAVVASAISAVQIVSWRGWTFSYAVVLMGMVGSVLFCAVAEAKRQRSVHVWRAPAVKHAAVVLGVYYVATGGFAALLGSAAAYLGAPVEVIEKVFATATVGAPQADAWPNTLSTVNELQRLGASTTLSRMGGPVFVGAGFLGVALAFLPRGPWRRGFSWVVVAGLLLVSLAVANQNFSRMAICVLVAVPCLVAVGWLLLRHRVDALVGAAIMVFGWAIGGLFLALGANRFELLCGPACGVGAGILVGRLLGWLTPVLQRRFSARYVVLLGGALLLALAVVLHRPLRNGHEVAHRHTPKLTDAWWDPLTKIKAESAADAIVNVWWEYGHWAKFVTERRVSADGGTLRTQVHHWLAKALLAPTEAETLGLLRMLACGSDATPYPEGELGAYGKILATPREPVEAYASVEALARKDLPAAIQYLHGRAFTESQLTDILRSTHCAPPEAFLVMSSTQLRKLEGWSPLGTWSPVTALARRLSGVYAPSEAALELRSRLGLEPDEAVALLQAAEDDPASEKVASLGERWEYFDADWFRCRPSQGDVLHCPIRATIGEGAGTLDALTYDPALAAPVTLHWTRTQRGKPPQKIDGPPGALLIASDTELTELPVEPSRYGEFGILLDLPNKRILIGAPELLRSTFTQLMFLDGRTTPRLRLEAEATSSEKERVTVWRIDWDAALAP